MHGFRASKAHARPRVMGGLPITTRASAARTRNARSEITISAMTASRGMGHFEAADARRNRAPAAQIAQGA